MESGDNIIYPYFGKLPEDSEYFEYLASVGILPDDLQNSCVKEVEVTGIADVDANTVNVEYDSVEYTNVPIWIHTDYGTRRREIRETPATTPQDYFERAAYLFPMEGAINLSTYTSGTCGGITATLVPKALALVHYNVATEVTKVLGIIRVVQSVDQELSNTSIMPTYDMILMVDATLYTTSAGTTKRTTALYSVAEKAIATIPNAAGTALMSAESETPSDFYYFLNGSFCLGSASTSFTAYHPTFTAVNSEAYPHVVHPNNYGSYVDLTDTVHTPAWVGDGANYTAQWGEASASQSHNITYTVIGGTVNAGTGSYTEHIGKWANIPSFANDRIIYNGNVTSMYGVYNHSQTSSYAMEGGLIRQYSVFNMDQVLRLSVNGQVCDSFRIYNNGDGNTLTQPWGSVLLRESYADTQTTDMAQALPDKWVLSCNGTFLTNGMMYIMVVDLADAVEERYYVFGTTSTLGSANELTVTQRREVLAAAHDSSLNGTPMQDLLSIVKSHLAGLSDGGFGWYEAASSPYPWAVPVFEHEYLEINEIKMFLVPYDPEWASLTLT